MKPTFILSWPKEYDDPSADLLINTLNKHFDVESRRTDPLGPWAASEWSIPTQIIVFIAGSFFGGVISEAAKDVYVQAKDAIKKYIIEKRELKTHLIVSTSSPNKLSSGYDQSLTISMRVRLHPRILVTVLINDRLSQQEVDGMLEGLFQTLSLLYEQCREDDEKDLSGFEGRPEQLYLLADVDKRQWEILTEKQVRDRYRS